ncbi:prepilin-type N-terminal cleavage/methylation domain-containing protein (plasmid) [Deinococcus radiomollis]|uniref:type II secretion system protein n=1 Tax=Deinococcus radiomollis TaxID=468916 RepID=UPI00389122E5
MRNSGFTLIELLISMALLGVVLGIVLAAQNAVITSSQQQQSSAGRLGVLTDITGYIGDRVRSAALVPDGLNVNGSPCLLAPTTGLPCLAVVLPQVGSSGQVSGWELHAFQYFDPATLSSQERTPGLSGVNVAVREAVLTSSCGTTVPTTSTLSSCFSGSATNNLLSDELSLPPSGTAAFSYDPAQQLMLLNMRSVSLLAGVTSYLPASGSYALKIYARNAH